MFKETYLKQDFILIGINGEEIVFRDPYFNEEKELAFRSCSHFLDAMNPVFVFNEKESRLDISHDRSNGSGFSIRLTVEDDVFRDMCIEAKQMLTEDIKTYAKNLKTGKEKVLIFESADSDVYPYWILTESILKKGFYSPKYLDGLVFYVSIETKKIQKEIEDYDDMHRILGEALKNVDLASFPKEQIDGKTAYVLTLNDLCYSLRAKMVA